MKIVLLDASTLGNLPEINRFGEYGELVTYAITHPEETKDRVKDADIVITNKVVINEAVMKEAAKLKLICVAATGTNNVDLAYAEKVGIAVKNVKGYSTMSVAQHTFAMLFHLMNHLAYYDNYVKSGSYSQSPVFTNLDREFVQLEGKVFGIIGLGAIGQKVASLAVAFGAKVIYYSTSGQNTAQPYPAVSLEELLHKSDIVSIHAPLNEKTKGLIRYKELQMMKKKAILLNVGRGGIINEPELAKALDEELIGAAGIDVFEQEPVDMNNPLLKIKNKEKLILTPHIAWASKEARVVLIDGVCKNIKSFIEAK